MYWLKEEQIYLDPYSVVPLKVKTPLNLTISLNVKTSLIQLRFKFKVVLKFKGKCAKMCEEVWGSTNLMTSHKNTCFTKNTSKISQKKKSYNI